DNPACWRWLLPGGQINGGKRTFVHRSVLHVAYHSDDVGHVFQRRHPELAACCRGITEELARDRRADDDSKRSGTIVLRAKATAVNDRNSHHIEIGWTSHPQDRFAVGLALMYADKTA